MKILWGDQVYLDYLTERFLLQTHTAAEMEIEFFENYMRAWGQRGITTGFRELLRDQKATQHYRSANFNTAVAELCMGRRSVRESLAERAWTSKCCVYRDGLRSCRNRTDAGAFISIELPRSDQAHGKVVEEVL